MRDSDIDALSADGAQDTERMSERDITLHAYTDKLSRNLCDSCNRWKGAAEHRTAPPAAHPADSAEALRAALALALHQTRDSNESPEFDMNVARARADRMLAYPNVRAALQASAPSPAAEPWDENKPHLFKSADLGNPTYPYCVCGRQRGALTHAEAERAAAEGPTGPEPPPDDG